MLRRSSPELANVFSFSKDHLLSQSLDNASDNAKKKDFTTFFRQIVDNAKKNVGKLPQSKRHSEVIKKFSTSLFLYSGPMAYNMIQKNMEDALPSLRTVQRTIHSEYHPLSEGQFQFDGLVNHLNKYNAPFVVAISEDATRVIARVEYDRENDRMVGFVLPCNENGLPLPNSFLATSFEVIEQCFRTCEVSKFAYIYVAQCVSPTVPAYCLACMGTNNSFTATDVLKRWRHIYLECQQRNVSVISFGGDGDSRLLRAMKISSQLKISGPDKSLYSLSPSSLTAELKLPKEWTWFWSEKITSILHIQDYVHVAVKLKSRLLKPSIILPMGQYLAGAHHLRILVNAFSKDQHGIRLTDINHKDRQNFDAVTRITSPSVFVLLEKIPDAKGTLKYLQLLRNFLDAFLHKHLTPLERIRKVWYTIFFLRYWHKWISCHKKYTIKENFITSNANSGVELNGHALVNLVMLMRDKIPNGSELFCPWLLGSQPCEQTFRAARSMTGTFSTVINFSIYALLQRLHRLQIQLQLESEMKETGIQYPRVINHVKKSGFSSDTTFPNLTEVSDKAIADTIESVRMEVISVLEDLGILVKDKDGKWEDLTLKVVNDKDNCDNCDDDADDDYGDDDDGGGSGSVGGSDKDDKSDSANKEEGGNEQVMEFINKDELQQDVLNLQKAGLVESQLSQKLQSQRMKKALSTTISLYSLVDMDSSHKVSVYVLFLYAHTFYVLNVFCRLTRRTIS